MRLFLFHDRYERADETIREEESGCCFDCDREDGCSRRECNDQVVCIALFRSLRHKLRYQLLCGIWAELEQLDAGKRSLVAESLRQSYIKRRKNDVKAIGVDDVLQMICVVDQQLSNTSHSALRMI